MMMMPGMTPEQVAKAKQIGNFVSASIVKHKRGFSIEFTPKAPDDQLAAAKVDISQIVDAFVVSLGTQLNTYMGITGTIKSV